MYRQRCRGSGKPERLQGVTGAGVLIHEEETDLRMDGFGRTWFGGES